MCSCARSLCVKFYLNFIHNQMKHFKYLFLLLALLAFAPAGAQEVPMLPIDPAVRVGVSPNGLTYYIRHNALPEKQAFF